MSNWRTSIHPSYPARCLDITPTTTCFDFPLPRSTLMCPNCFRYLLRTAKDGGMAWYDKYYPEQWYKYNNSIRLEEEKCCQPWDDKHKSIPESVHRYATIHEWIHNQQRITSRRGQTNRQRSIPTNDTAATTKSFEAWQQEVLPKLVPQKKPPLALLPASSTSSNTIPSPTKEGTFSIGVSHHPPPRVTPILTPDVDLCSSTARRCIVPTAAAANEQDCTILYADAQQRCATLDAVHNSNNYIGPITPDATMITTIPSSMLTSHHHHHHPIYSPIRPPPPPVAPVPHRLARVEDCSDTQPVPQPVRVVPPVSMQPNVLVVLGADAAALPNEDYNGNEHYYFTTNYQIPRKMRNSTTTPTQPLLVGMDRSSFKTMVKQQESVINSANSPSTTYDLEQVNNDPSIIATKSAHTRHTLASIAARPSTSGGPTYNLLSSRAAALAATVPQTTKPPSESSSLEPQFDDAPTPSTSDLPSKPKSSITAKSNLKDASTKAFVVNDCQSACTGINAKENTNAMVKTCSLASATPTHPSSLESGFKTKPNACVRPSPWSLSALTAMTPSVTALGRPVSSSQPHYDALATNIAPATVPHGAPFHNPMMYQRAFGEVPPPPSWYHKSAYLAQNGYVPIAPPVNYSLHVPTPTQAANPRMPYSPYQYSDYAPTPHQPSTRCTPYWSDNPCRSPASPLTNSGWGPNGCQEKNFPKQSAVLSGSIRYDPGKIYYELKSFRNRNKDNTAPSMQRVECPVASYSHEIHGP